MATINRRCGLFFLAFCLIFFTTCSKNDSHNGDGPPPEHDEPVYNNISGLELAEAPVQNGKDLFPQMSFPSGAATSGLELTWPSDAKVFTTWTTVPPCPSQDGYTNHPFQRAECLGFFRTKFAAGAIDLYFNSGSTERFLGMIGFTHTYSYSIQDLAGTFYFKTPTERMELVAVGTSGADANSFRYRNSLYGSTVFVRNGSTMTTKIGDDVWTFSQTGTAGDFILRKIASILRSVDLAYSSNPTELSSIVTKDLRAGGKTTTATITANAASNPPSVIVSEGDASKAVTISIVDSFLSVIRNGATGVQFQVLSNSSIGRRFPIAVIRWETGVRRSIDYYGYDRLGHLYYAKHGKETLKYWYSTTASLAKSYVTITDRFGSQMWFAFEKVGSFILPTSAFSESGTSQFQYDTAYPNGLNRTYDPLMGWTEMGVYGDKKIVTFPDRSTLTYTPQPNGGVLIEKSDGSLFEFTTTEGQGTLYKTMTSQQGSVRSNVMQTTSISSDIIQNSSSIAGGNISDIKSIETRTATGFTRNLQDEMTGSRTVIVGADSSSSVDLYPTRSSTVPFVSLQTSNLINSYTAKQKIYGTTIAREAGNFTATEATISSIQFDPGSLANKAESESVTINGYQSNRKWGEPSDVAGANGLGIVGAGPIPITAVIIDDRPGSTGDSSVWIPGPNGGPIITAVNYDTCEAEPPTRTCWWHITNKICSSSDPTTDLTAWVPAKTENCDKYCRSTLTAPTATNTPTSTTPANTPTTAPLTTPTTAPTTAPTPTKYTLSVTRAGTASASIVVSGYGITCPAVCSATFNSGSTVVLSASPAGTIWSGACSGTGSCSVVMNSNKTVTATLNLGNHGDPCTGTGQSTCEIGLTCLSGICGIDCLQENALCSTAVGATPCCASTVLSCIGYPTKCQRAPAPTPTTKTTTCSGTVPWRGSCLLNCDCISNSCVGGLCDNQ